MNLLSDTLQKPLFIAHRGLCRRYPENTLAAFAGSIADGAQMIELDVTLSRDRQPVVIHDTRVDRTTNSRGPVSAFTVRELARLDAGSWFGPKFAGEPVPSLADVLDAVNGRIMVNIEIKPEAFEVRRPADAIECQILEMVMERGMEAAVLISSFAWRVLARISDSEPSIALGLLSASPVDERLLYWLRRTRAFSWHPDYRVVNRDQVRLVHHRGVQVFPYAVAGTIDSTRLLAAGVDGLIVDDPTQMSAHQPPSTIRE